MSTKNILFQFHDVVKEISLNDIVIVTDRNRRNTIPQEYTITKIGRKYATFTLGDGESTYGEIQFDFEGRENSNYCNNSVYSSLGAYEQMIRNEKAQKVFYVLVKNQYKFTEDQIQKAALALNIFGEYSEGMAK